MAAKRKAKQLTKAKSKRAAAKAKRPPAKAKRVAAKRRAPTKRPRPAPKPRVDASEAVTAAHRAFDPEATQQLSSKEVLGDIEESMALDTLKEDA